MVPPDNYERDNQQVTGDMVKSRNGKIVLVNHTPVERVELQGVT